MLTLTTKKSIAHYLIARGLLTRKEIVDGSLTVVDRTSRHRNFLVLRGSQPGYFVKHIQPGQFSSAQTLEREAACYRLIHSEPKFSPLSPLVPRLYAYDPVNHVLVLELLSEAENLGAYQTRENKYPEAIAGRLGATLGGYHLATRDALTNGLAARAATLSRAVPWILEFHRSQPETLSMISPANAQMYSVLNKYPGFARKLDEIRESWNAGTLIHADMKFENCALYYPQGKMADPEMKIVDWEMAGFGDPAWDVGSILQAYLNCWLLSIPPTPGASPEQLESQAKVPLSSIQPAIQAFWRAYAQTMRLEETEASGQLRRCVAHAAARMLQTVFEWMHHYQQLTPNAAFQLQVSLNMLERPDEAIPVLLGL